MFDLVELVIIGFVAFITIYAVVDRICKCIESKANAKAFSSISNPDVLGSMVDAVNRMKQD